MAVQNSVTVPITYEEAGFAKLQGEYSSYIMRDYSITLGRNSQTSKVDLVLSDFGKPIKRVSRCHARIFYDFEQHHFALEVLGRHGCKIQGVLYPPSSDPIKLNSQDLIEIQGIKIYFLLPTRSIHATIAAQRSNPVQAPNQLGCSSYGKNSDKGKKIGPTMQGKLKQQKKSSGSGESSMSKSCDIAADSNGAHGEQDNSKCNKDKKQLLPKEEKDVVSSIATVISELCGPRELLPMLKLHSKLLERFGETWCLDDISRYLTPEDGSSTRTNGKPWCKLLLLLKNHPEIFVTETMATGEAAVECVGLVSLPS